MAKNGFTKATKEQRERLRARRSEGRAILRARLLEETRLGCYLYLGGADGALTPRELTSLRREFGSSHIRTIPSRDSLARKVRSFVLGCRPSVRERRELLAQLREFALCDGALSPGEDDVLRVIEDLLQLSRESRKARGVSWGRSAKDSSAGGTTTKRARGDSKQSGRAWRQGSDRAAQPERPRAHWSYEYLGCSEHDSDETVKRCYRRLALKLHPDKHAARGATPEETLKHIRAFQKLQAAYEAVLKLRSA